MANRTLFGRRAVSSASAALAVTLAALGLAAGCSAPDPGEIPYRAPPPRGPRPVTTAVVAATDAGSADDGAVFQLPYAAGAAKLSSTQDEHVKQATIGTKNPAGHSCVNECHSAGGAAVAISQTAVYSAGGTIYTDQTGNTPVGAGVEVRIRNPNGAAVSVYTDENGNFFVRQSEFEIQQGASSGIRNAAQPMLMVSNLAAGALGGACANGNGCHAKGGLGGVLRVKN